PDTSHSSETVVNRSATLAYLKTRRSPQLTQLNGPAPSADDVREMLTVASRVPDHGKLVPWRFIMFRGDRRHEISRVISDRFAEANPDASEERCKAMEGRLALAPLVVAVVFSPREHPKIPQWEQQLTVGAVCLNLLHAARALGFGGNWLTEWYSYDEAVLRHLGLAEREQLAGFIHIGVPAEERGDRARPDLAEIVTEY
ncbi:MAG: nitroreductase, partial [Planctomycetota bacterium]